MKDDVNPKSSESIQTEDCRTSLSNDKVQSGSLSAVEVLYFYIGFALDWQAVSGDTTYRL